MKLIQATATEFQSTTEKKGDTAELRVKINRMTFCWVGFDTLTGGSVDA